MNKKNQETITLALKEYIPPDCTCAVEDRIRALHGVHEVHLNPVADTVHLLYDGDVVNLEHLKHMLAELDCSCEGEPERPAHAHMQHEGQKAAGHGHHA
ncbi:MAG: hypothetical protein GTO63_14295, partial [Anaerolineae bacterium]|nr:hypothetical protein [Anaerolineae bacterium]NIN96018.1 hypothetical protein [Anaerolineae bacterium]NIQ79048.1 hypothetical protein [Anaerolineae bacterium]